MTEKFLTNLVDGKEVDANKIELLRSLLVHSKKPKPEDFVKIFVLPAGGDLK
jgi:hypothetical protein